ncbi:hypothetical protein ACVWVQ_002380 [Thermostichus sp. MS-CIW-36]|jgi:hypothetical protein
MPRFSQIVSKSAGEACRRSSKNLFIVSLFELYFAASFRWNILLPYWQNPALTWGCPLFLSDWSAICWFSTSKSVIYSKLF